MFKNFINSFKGLSQETWMLSIVMLINRSGAMVIPFLGIYMTQHLHFSLRDSGSVLAAFGLGSVIGSWFGGWVTDKIGEYKVQSWSLLLSVPLFCLLPMFKTELSLGVMIFILSLVSECFRPANSVAISKYAKPGNLTRAFSLNRMAVNLGFSVGPALGGILAAISYDFLFYTNAFTVFVAALVYIYFFKERNKQFQIKKSETEKVVVPKELSPYRDRKFIFYSIFCLIFSICFFQIFSSLTIFYEKEAHLSQTHIGYLLAFSGLVVVLLEMLLVNVAEKRFTLGKTLFLGSLFCGISYAMLIFNHHFLFLALAMVFLSVGEIWALPFMSTITAIRSEGRSKGAYMGMNGMAFSAAFVITPYVGTRVAESMGFDFLWAVTGILFLITAIAFYYIVPWLLKKQ